MASAFFDFKQFRVYHDKCAMKVGTDSVVLGAAVQVDPSIGRILDIGTGSGILALMMAQKSQADIIGLEIEPLALQQAKENFANSPWANRLTALPDSIQRFSSLPKFGLILSNPPYFPEGKSFAIQENTRRTARQTGSLSSVELLESVQQLLEPNGLFWLILPTKNMEVLEELAINYGLYLNHDLAVYSKPNASHARRVAAFGFKQSIPHREQIVLYDLQGNRTQEYARLCAEFYL